MKKEFTEGEVTTVAEEILKHISLRAISGRATLLALSGDLGAGKTTLSQALARMLGVTEHVISPTFLIQKKYALEGQKWKSLIHIDAYRLDHSRELLTLGWEETLRDPDNLILLEWPEKVVDILPESAYRVSLEHSENGTRTISF